MRDNHLISMTSLRVWPVLVDFAMIAIRTPEAEVTLTQYQGRVMMYMNAAGLLVLLRSRYTYSHSVRRGGLQDGGTRYQARETRNLLGMEGMSNSPCCHVLWRCKLVKVISDTLGRRVGLEKTREAKIRPSISLPLRARYSGRMLYFKSLSQSQ